MSNPAFLRLSLTDGNPLYVRVDIIGNLRTLLDLQKAPYTRIESITDGVIASVRESPEYILRAMGYTFDVPDAAQPTPTSPMQQELPLPPHSDAASQPNDAEAVSVL